MHRATVAYKSPSPTSIVTWFEIHVTAHHPDQLEAELNEITADLTCQGLTFRVYR